MIEIKNINYNYDTGESLQIDMDIELTIYDCPVIPSEMNKYIALALLEQEFNISEDDLKNTFTERFI